MSGATVTEPGERAVDRRVWIRTLAFTIAATAALAACSCSTDDDDPPPPTTEETKEEEVETAYLAFAEMGARLLAAPNPDDPEIRERTSGEAQANLIDGLTSLRDANERYELGPNYEHEVLSIDVADGSATAVVCVVDDIRLLDAATGDVKGQGTTTAQWTVSLIRSNPTWVIDRIDESELGQGVLPCE